MSVAALVIRSAMTCDGSPARGVTHRLMSIKSKRSQLSFYAALLALVSPCSCDQKHKATGDNRVVRCAVIGGMSMTGLWPEIAKMFEAETGYQTELVVTGPRPELD